MDILYAAQEMRLNVFVHRKPQTPAKPRHAATGQAGDHADGPLADHDPAPNCCAFRGSNKLTLCGVASHTRTKNRTRPSGNMQGQIITVVDTHPHSSSLARVLRAITHDDRPQQPRTRASTATRSRYRSTGRRCPLLHSPQLAGHWLDRRLAKLADAYFRAVTH